MFMFQAETKYSNIRQKQNKQITCSKASTDHLQFEGKDTEGDRR